MSLIHKITMGEFENPGAFEELKKSQEKTEQQPEENMTESEQTEEAPAYEHEREYDFKFLEESEKLEIGAEKEQEVKDWFMKELHDQLRYFKDAGDGFNLEYKLKDMCQLLAQKAGVKFDVDRAIILKDYTNAVDFMGDLVYYDREDDGWNFHITDSGMKALDSGFEKFFKQITAK